MNRTLQQWMAACLMGGVAHGADLSVVGGWTQTITASDLTAGAGSGLRPNFDSIEGATTMSVYGVPGGWTVLARRGSGNWHSGVRVFVRRTSAGMRPGGGPTGGGSIQGGEAFIELTGTDTVFFSGTYVRDGIAIQYRLTGVSSQVAPAAYSAPILFTVQ